MKSLIDDILTLESEANAALEEARARAKEIEKTADQRIGQAQDEVQAVVERRLAQFRAEAEKKHQEALAQARAEHEQALKKLEQVPASVLDEQVRRVVARFREL
ncbi:MAG: hypothetical protein KA184_20070 [Candidatus Hydrogenedentes bacterium]|nr:hypothetical protein [Candidatus Hydrogenedentota bacterium]